MTLAPVDRLASLTDADCLALRERLIAAGYDAKLIGFAESIAPSLFDALRLPLVLWALRKRNDAASQLGRLFAYADALTRGEATKALGASFEPALAAGVVIADGDAVRAGFRLFPAEGLYVIGDDPTAGGDAAMSPGPTTLQLMGLVPRAVRGDALDVGCGPGTIALFAAMRGARRAVGVDINARAITMANFNARLNGLRAEFRVGDLLAPVAGERFDLVLAQPPYVIQPQGTAQVTYLHGGAMGDEIAMRLLGEISGAMARDGRAIVLFDSAVRANEPLHARVRRALGAAPCDIVILAAKGPPPDQQALAYGAVEAPDLGVRYAEAVVRYRAHLDALGVTEVTHALVALRSRADAERAFTVTLPVRDLPRGDPDAIERTFGALDLAAGTDGDVLGARVRGAARARFVEERARPDPDVEPSRAARFAPGSVASDRELSEAAFALLAILERSPDVGSAVRGYAEACEASPDEVREQVLDFVRDGLARGLLEIARH